MASPAPINLRQATLALVLFSCLRLRTSSRLSILRRQVLDSLCPSTEPTTCTRTTSPRRRMVSLTSRCTANVSKRVEVLCPLHL